MTQLNHQGPENEGPRTGRRLGRCNTSETQPQGEPGKGMGMKRHSGGGTGKGKRLKSSHIFNTKPFGDATQNSNTHKG